MIKYILTAVIFLLTFFSIGYETNIQYNSDPVIEQMRTVQENLIESDQSNESLNAVKDVTLSTVNTIISESKEYVPPINYDTLFDFSGWEIDFEEASDKDDFMENYWRQIAIETVSDYKIYTLLLNDENAKNAFFNEIREQMILQAEAYLKSSKITVDDEMKEFITDMIDSKLKDFMNSIHN